MKIYIKTGSQFALTTKHNNNKLSKLELLHPVNNLFEKTLKKSIFHRRSPELSLVCLALKRYKMARNAIYYSSNSVGLVNTSKSKSTHLYANTTTDNKLIKSLQLKKDLEPIVELTRLQAALDIWQQTQPKEVKQRGCLLNEMPKEIQIHFSNHLEKRLLINQLTM
ncbi:hypothetical protein [Spartinivicinus ruber]|uniref:hypothetical protein n=1 Tax=Spartinivicinus ruber TaxID=2683272 RepID=UPI0013D42013|nr:hypothetical protein [Spartinivicinus ruber]